MTVVGKKHFTSQFQILLQKTRAANHSGWLQQRRTTPCSFIGYSWEQIFIRFFLVSSYTKSRYFERRKFGNELFV